MRKLIKGILAGFGVLYLAKAFGACGDWIPFASGVVGMLIVIILEDD